MNVKSILTLIIMLIFFAICWKYYTNNLKRVCCDCSNKATTEIVNNNSPLLFYPNTDSPIMDNFDAYRDSICKMSQDTKIDLIGYYEAEETNSTAFDNLGLARAQKMKELMSDCLNSANVSLYGEKKDCEEFNGNLLACGVAASKVVDMNSNEVQVVDNHGTSEIYFPSGSNKSITGEAIDNLVANIVANDKDSKIRIVGHTDNTGSAEANNALSLSRANTIKDILVNAGVPADNITCEGKGSSMPKVDNSTEENRAMNRRVELTVVK